MVRVIPPRRSFRLRKSSPKLPLPRYNLPVPLPPVLQNLEKNLNPARFRPRSLSPFPSVVLAGNPMKNRNLYRLQVLRSGSPTEYPHRPPLSLIDLALAQRLPSRPDPEPLAQEPGPPQKSALPVPVKSRNRRLFRRLLRSFRHCLIHFLRGSQGRSPKKSRSQK